MKAIPWIFCHTTDQNQPGKIQFALWGANSIELIIVWGKVYFFEREEAN
jgi:hypothetical protein